MLYQAVRLEYPLSDCMTTHLRPTELEAKRVLAAAENYDTIIFGAVNAILYKEQADLLNAILKLEGKKIIVVAMDSPYDYEVLEAPCRNYIATFGAVAASMYAAVGVISGELPGDAVPPVDINMN